MRTPRRQRGWFGVHDQRHTGGAAPRRPPSPLRRAVKRAQNARAGVTRAQRTCPEASCLTLCTFDGRPDLVRAGSQGGQPSTVIRCAARVRATYRTRTPPGDSAVISAGSTITVASYSRHLVDIGSTTLTRPEETSDAALIDAIQRAGEITAIDPATSPSSTSTAWATAAGIPSPVTDVTIGETPVSRTASGKSASGTSARITSAA